MTAFLKKIGQANNFQTAVIFLSLLSLLPRVGLAQSTASFTRGDTLIIRDETIVNDLFGFGNDPLQYLSKQVQPRPQIEKQAIRSRLEVNQIDTAYRMAVGHDVFVVDKSSVGRNFLLHADVSTKAFKTKHGLAIGMTKADIVKTLAAYEIRSIPNYLVLEDRESVNRLVLYFDKKGVLEFLELFVSQKPTPH